MTEPFVSPDVGQFLAFLNAQEGPKLYELPLAEARQMFVNMGQLVEEPLGELAVEKDLTIPVPAGDIPARLYDTRTERPAGPMMVFYHGGGFVIGDLDTHGPYCAEAARRLDIPVVSIDYRLAPEHVFPAAAEDCEAATRWIAENMDCTGLVLAGDSAGGNLTVITAMALRDQPAAKPVIAQFPIYPAVSVKPDWPSLAQFAEGYFLSGEMMMWFGAQYQWDPEDWRANPLDHDQSGMPPSLVVTASLDPLHDQGKAYYEKLIASGVRAEYHCAEGNIHGFINMRKAIPSANEAAKAHLDALKAMLASL